MTNKTTENFWEAWSGFQWPEPVVPSYRLYYNDNGTPKCYSMDRMPDKYVEVDAETFALQPWNVLVVEGKLTFVQPKIQVQRLSPNQLAGTRCHPQDICVVVQEQQPHIKWNKTINEIS